eukprot:TRINITY_DN3357_c0_g1_i1.p1 TRINITY_DN3357_c0_g1~~TRINITY_DN3357_c0_g1_i1.p1  ORF type:complete len:252 (-),score=70.65 TRINITY_DN3357_c0_g1_i1:66-821(-)
MARRYDTRTTIFSPDGRLFQVEYAMEAINRDAGTAVGILTKEGVVLVAEKLVTSKLLDSKASSEKMYKIDDHMACAVAGITADANIVINYARLSSQRYTFQYDEPSPVEVMVQTICDLKQGYTQYGGLRPFGVSFLIAGWDKHYGFQLYKTDPSGNYGGWKATSIGSGHQQASSVLKTDYNDELNIQSALKLATKILSKTMDSTQLTHEKLEYSTLTRENGVVKFHVFTDKEIDDVIASTPLEEKDDQASK